MPSLLSVSGEMWGQLDNQLEMLPGSAELAGTLETEAQSSLEEEEPGSGEGR